MQYVVMILQVPHKQASAFQARYKWLTDGQVRDTMIQHRQAKFRFSKEVSRAVTKLAVHVNDIMSIELSWGNPFDVIIMMAQCDKLLAASFILANSLLVMFYLFALRTDWVQ